MPKIGPLPPVVTQTVRCINCGRKWFYTSDKRDCRSLVAAILVNMKPLKKENVEHFEKWKEGYLAGVTDACNALGIVTGWNNA